MMNLENQLVELFEANIRNSEAGSNKVTEPLENAEGEASDLILFHFECIEDEIQTMIRRCRKAHGKAFNKAVARKLVLEALDDAIVNYGKEI